MREFWGDALAVYGNVFLIYCLLAALVLMLTGVRSPWVQVPLPPLTVLGATAGYMSARSASGRGFAWNLRPTNGAYLAGLLGGVLMTLLLLAGTWH